jgi:hypothetical protein
LKLNRIIVALCALALAVPAAVMAQGPSGDHGKSGQQHGNANHPSKRCKHQPLVGYNYGGTLDATSTATNLVINVTHANHWAKSLKGTQVTISGADLSKVHYNPASPFGTDGNANPGVDLTKFNVQVVGRVGRPKHGCTFDNSVVTIKRINVNAPDSNDQETETETQTTSQS